MRKRIVAKGNLRRGDFMRAVVTDTLPEEVPIIFSNDGFYVNTNGSRALGVNEADFVEALLADDRPYTIPYRYRVVKDQSSTRGLSLVHPSSQKKVALFYQKYDALICYYAKKSGLSLRTPYKVGSTYFMRGLVTNRNAQRAISIDTLSIENSVSNPASYFSYNKISRAHQFFDSNDYLKLEKRFQVFRALDVSKCFNSIYTHTMFWAVGDVETAKNNTNSSGFGNEFDRLMQSMNYNETNGICIGPEVSRVFAEIILSDIDTKIVSSLEEADLKIRSDYDIRRYIDDYYVFAKDLDTADVVTGNIQRSLAAFNLHLNERKTVTLTRPFSTTKSQIIADADSAIKSFVDRFISPGVMGETHFSYPSKILRSDALIRGFVKSIKATCMLHKSDYQSVSDYIVSAMKKRVVELADGYFFGITNGSMVDEYIAAIMVLVETSYFFYTVNPTVRSSLNLARSIVTANKLVQQHMPDRAAYFSESIVRWTIELAKSMDNGSHHRRLAAVPIEVLNILIPMKEIAENEPLIDVLVTAMCERVSEFEYFEIVTFLYLIDGRHAHGSLTTKLFGRAKAIVKDGVGPKVDSQAAHLCLDLLACPHLPRDKRGSWYNTLRSRSGLPKLPRVDAQATVADMEAHPWFVRWEGLDLLSILKKKELSVVY